MNYNVGVGPGSFSCMRITSVVQSSNLPGPLYIVRINIAYELFGGEERVFGGEAPPPPPPQ